MKTKVKFESETMLDGLYAAGEDLAARLTLSVEERRTVLTAKELCLSPEKGGVKFSYPKEEFAYSIVTPTGTYEADMNVLFNVIYNSERAEGVTTAKRHRFTLTSPDKERKVLVRITFEADNTVAKMKRCYATDGSRPVLSQPAIDVKNGVMVASDGRILAAHKLKNYIAEGSSSEQCVLVPREVTKMKGTVNVEVSEERGAVFTRVTDSKGVSGCIEQTGRFPNWVPVVPSKIGPAVCIDAPMMAKVVKRLSSQINQSSQLLKVDAERGADALTLSGSDVDFSLSASETVPAVVPAGVWTAVRAPLLLDVLGFGVTAMHVTDRSHPILFFSPDTLLILMPMLRDDSEPSPRYTPGNSDLEKFDVSDWLSGDTPTRPKAKVKPKVNPKPNVKVAAEPTPTPPESPIDKLRSAIRSAMQRQGLAVAA